MLKLLIILVSVTPLIVSVTAGKFYTSENGNSFYVEKEKKHNWYEAMYVCVSRNLTLITPDTEEKLSEITKLISTANIVDSAVWTAGLEVANFNFMWATTRKFVTNTNFKVSEAMRFDGPSLCIQTSGGHWMRYKCISERYVICEQHHVAEDLNELKIRQIDEINQIKYDYETKTNVKLKELHELKELYQNTTLALNEYKKQLDSCNLERNSELNALKKLYENDGLKEKNREKSLVQLDCEKQLNELMYDKEIHLLKNYHEMENDMLKMFHAKENEMLKRYYEKEVHILEEKQKFALNSLKISYDFQTSRTGVNKS